MPMWGCLAQSRVHRARPLSPSSSRPRSAARPPRSRRTPTPVDRAERANKWVVLALSGTATFMTTLDSSIVNIGPAVIRTRLWRTAVGQYRVGPDRLSRRHRGRLAHLWTAGRHAGTQAALPGRSRGLHTQLGALRGRALTGHAHRRALLPGPGCGRHSLRQRRHDHALVPRP